MICISRLFHDCGVSRAGYDGPPPLCLWLVAALTRGDRNETWPLLLRGWSFPLPWRCWRLTRACRSRVSPPPFTPAWISQTLIAPGGGPVQKEVKEKVDLTDHLTHCPLFSTEAAEPIFLLCWGEGFCLFGKRINVFYLRKRVRMSCHGVASACIRHCFGSWAVPWLKSTSGRWKNTEKGEIHHWGSIKGKVHPTRNI